MAPNLDGPILSEESNDLAFLEQRDLFQVALSSIGDAVITADANGHVTFLNSVAQSWTGWTQAAALGRPLETVVRIVNEVSREPVENPSTRALREGTIIKLADSSMLVSRNGVERPVGDSASPIRDRDGKIVGVVLIFLDCTDRRRDEHVSRDKIRYAEEILATLREPFLVLNKDLRIVTSNTSFHQRFHTSEDETTGRYLYELGNRQWDLPELRTLLEAAIPKSINVDEFEVTHDFPAIGLRTMRLNARRFASNSEYPNLILLAIRDVTKENSAEVALQESELRFRRLFQTAKDGILILDTDLGTIIDANPFICGLLGYEVEDFLGKELWEIGLFRDRDANREAYRELRTIGYVRYEHLPLKTKKGAVVEVEFVSNLYTMGNRRVAQCNIRDITLRCELERQAKTQAAALADLHRRKDEFLAMLSHELRNPLSPILNAVYLLRTQGNESLIQKEARMIIERQVGQLSHLVDDLMEVARFTTGKVKLQKLRLDMRSVLERAIESARPFIDRHGHKLSVSIPDAPIWLLADSTRLEQVVVNLLNNAAKYTEGKGEIWLETRSDGKQMVLTVRDTGIGIDLEQFPDVFDLFTQATRSLDRSDGGLGIGLALVQRLVEKHDGTVQVQSKGLGHGSEFTVRIPLLVDAAELPPAPTKSPDRPKDASRVLVVDDNVDSAEILASLLRFSGHDVRTAFSGPIALELAAEFLPEVVLLDIGLPVINGYEVARRLRQNPRLKGVKLLAMTGYGSETDRQLAMEAGFDKHLVKPVDFVTVEALLTTMLKTAATE